MNSPDTVTLLIFNKNITDFTHNIFIFLVIKAYTTNLVIVDNLNTHGTGCTLSSAIASNLAKGFALAESVQRAKEYISSALSAQLDLGQGSGPMMHNFDLTSHFAEEKISD